MVDTTERSPDVLLRSVIPPEPELTRGMRALEELHREDDLSTDNLDLHHRFSIGRADENGTLAELRTSVKAAAEDARNKLPLLKLPDPSDLPPVESGLFVGSLGQRLTRPFPIHDTTVDHMGQQPTATDVSAHEAGVVRLSVGPTEFKNVYTSASATIGVGFQPPVSLNPLCELTVRPRFYSRYSTSLSNFAGPEAYSEGRVRLSVLRFSSGVFQEIAFTTGWEKLWTIPLSAGYGPLNADSPRANLYTHRGRAELRIGDSYTALLSVRIRVRGWGPTRDDDVPVSDVYAELIGWNAYFDVTFEPCVRPGFRLPADFQL